MTDDITQMSNVNDSARSYDSNGVRLIERDYSFFGRICFDIVQLRSDSQYYGRRYHDGRCSYLPYGGCSDLTQLKRELDRLEWGEDIDRITQEELQALNNG